MKVLNIPYESNLICKQIQTYINTYKFTEESTGPNVDIYSCHDSEKLKFKFTIHEPICEVKNFHPNFPEEINKDSTVGIILQPYLPDPRNMILRINAEGAYFMSFGQWYWNRANCTFERNDFIKITNNYDQLILKHSPFWEISVEISLPLLFRFINLTDWKYTHGMSMRGNFLKIKKTPSDNSHFGMWNEVERNTFDCYKSTNLGEFILE